ncbi:hypothetical protein AN478_10550 [Thiohalorhabdus denitrificans]|nr:hypothetical protein AN478_10550 [Thiohalorhabdus denitrificans]
MAELSSPPYLPPILGVIRQLMATFTGIDLASRMGFIDEEGVGCLGHLLAKMSYGQYLCKG